MNQYVLLSLLLFLAPSGCPTYTIELSTIELPEDCQNELILQSMLTAELYQPVNTRTISSTGSSTEETALLCKDPGICPHQREREFNNNCPLECDASQRILRHLRPKKESSPMDEPYKYFLGTNLFAVLPKKCFSGEDIALMTARRDFEALVPKNYPASLISDTVVFMMMKYFNTVNQIIKLLGKDDGMRLLQRSFYDALGGYLRYYMVPLAKASYYAGRLKLCTVERLVKLYMQCKVVLNTNGNYWKPPPINMLRLLNSVHIVPLNFNPPTNSEKEASSCAFLDQTCNLKNSQNGQMLFPLPRLEAEDSNGHLGNIFLPFKQRRIYNLQAPNSAFILVKFFTTVTRCYSFQGVSQQTYNTKLQNWIRESVQIHYKDEVFYPGFGGILQIYQYIQCNSQRPKPTPQSETMNIDVSEWSKDDAKDYEVSPEEMNNQGPKCPKYYEQSLTTLAPAKKRKGNSTAGFFSKAKRSRHVPHLLSDSVAERIYDSKPDLAKRQGEEECMDCSNRYVVYIAIILGICFILLLILILCCVRRGENKKKLQSALQENKMPEEPKTSEEQSQPSFSEEGCCATLFYSKSKVKKEQQRQNRSQEKNPKNKTASPQENGSKVKEHRTGANSFTSTSSLQCQLVRKCLPATNRQNKSDHYYPHRKLSIWDGGREVYKHNLFTNEQSTSPLDSPNSAHPRKSGTNNITISATMEKKRQRDLDRVTTKEMAREQAFKHQSTPTHQFTDRISKKIILLQKYINFKPTDKDSSDRLKGEFSRRGLSTSVNSSEPFIMDISRDNAKSSYKVLGTENMWDDRSKYNSSSWQTIFEDY